MDWFSVDKTGLAKLLERKGKEFALYELIQNAWDEAITTVRVDLKRMHGGFVRLSVEDDNPEGFRDLSHAFTLFAESHKKADATKRGRFNLGEKLVLAICTEAVIRSTKGMVVFDKHGRREDSKARLNRGSVFVGQMRMTTEEFKACETAMRKLLVPSGVVVWFNDEQLTTREPLACIENVELTTEVADSEGFLRRASRHTNIEVFEPLDGETAMLYEMGIPVVETDDRWHLNIKQKVPLTLDRDNAPPAYLSRVRALVTEHMADNLSTEDANSTWVRDALQRNANLMTPPTVLRLADLRFGERRVAFDPSDPEANHLAATAGYTVVTGSQLSKAEWAAMRSTGAILPAGRVTPSPKPFHEDGTPLKLVAPEKWKPEVDALVAYAKRIAYHLMSVNVTVGITTDVRWPFAGAYGNGHLTINVGRLGYKWVKGPLVDINDFLIHEFGHQYNSNHLSEEYYNALTRLGAKMTQLALEYPDLFKRLKVSKTK